MSNSWFDDLGIPLSQLSLNDDRIPYDLFRDLSLRTPGENIPSSRTSQLSEDVLPAQDEIPDNWNWSSFSEPIEEVSDDTSNAPQQYRTFERSNSTNNLNSSSRYQRVFNTRRAAVEMPIGPYPADTFWNPNRETQKQIYDGRAYLVYHAVENPKELEALAKIDYPMNRPIGPEQLTPLMLAAKTGNVESIAVILLYGIPPYSDLNSSYLLDQVDPENQTALMHAVKANQSLAVKKLLWWGMQTSRQTIIANNERKTPLFVASQNGNLPIVRMLFHANPSTIDTLDEDGLSPLDIAALNGHLSVVAYLREQGARGGPRTYILGDNQRWLMMPLQELEAEIAQQDNAAIPIF